jgi:hypothetical protein
VTWVFWNIDFPVLPAALELLDAQDLRTPRAIDPNTAPLTAPLSNFSRLEHSDGTYFLLFFQTLVLALSANSYSPI